VETVCIKVRVQGDRTKLNRNVWTNWTNWQFGLLRSLCTRLYFTLLYTFLFTQKVANNTTAHTKRKNKRQEKTYDTKKQCLGVINLQNKTHEESLLLRCFEKCTFVAVAENGKSYNPIRTLSVGLSACPSHSAILSKQGKLRPRNFCG